MTQAADYAIHVQLSVGPKHDFQQNFSLELERAGFIRISRIWFESNLHRIGGRTRICKLPARAVGKFLLPEAAGSYSVAAAHAAHIAVAAGRDAIAESRAGNGALHPLRAARAVSVAWALRHIERSRGSGHQVCARLAFSLESIRIAKAASLHFLDRSIQGRRRRTTRRKLTGMNQLRTRATRDFLQLRWLEIVDHYLGRFRFWLGPGLRNPDFAGHNQMRRSDRHGWKQFRVHHLRLWFR